MGPEVGWLEQLQERPAFRLVGVAVGGAAMATTALTAPPEGLDPVAWRTAGVAAAMAGWWLVGTLPLTVTALVPLVAFPLLRIAPIGQAAAPYAHPLIFLMVGGFLLGFAMERVGLHERLVAALLRPERVRASPRRVVMALMVAAALMSAIVSNTATAVMLLPIALLLADRAGATGRARAAHALGLAWASSIGGVSTLIGTFPNAVFAQAAASLADRPVDFASWLWIGVPFTALALPVAGWVVTRMYVPAEGPRIPPAPPIPSWRPGERAVLAVVGLALVAWVTRGPLAVGPLALPGWAAASGLGKAVDDAWVAMVAGLSLFLIPAGGRPLLSFREAERSLPWSLMFLLGGGFSLADTIERTGLTTWLAGGTAALAALPTWAAVLAIALLVTFLTELTSNTATTQILLPLLAAGAAAAGVDPILWMVPATISASCAFMMPVATPPNAVAAEAGGVRAEDMARAGLVLNLLLALLVTAIALLLGPIAFPPR